MARTFELTKAKRVALPVLMALSGPTGSGKTYSALRLAAGIQRVAGGKVGFLDTESRRALHYADEFDFEHIDVKPPFGSLDYLAGVLYLQSQGCNTVIADSMTHEHTGAGGLLEQSEAFLAAKCGDDWKKRDRMKWASWVQPKQNRQKMIDGILQSGVNLICCFRAKDKIKPVSGGDPLHLGFTPVGAEELVYEMMVSVLLTPRCDGVPDWKPELKGEQQLVKIEKPLIPMFETGRKREALSEKLGELIAKWAAGEGSPSDASEGGVSTPKPGTDASPPSTGEADEGLMSNNEMDALLADISDAADTSAVSMLAKDARDKDWTDDQRNLIKKTLNARNKELTK